jgi:hypothetical protein
MLGAESYPITVAELWSYVADAEHIFGEERHDRLKEILAFNPEHGELIKGSGGVRHFIWQIADGGDDEVQVVYFFRDLEMPLFLIAICFEPFEEFDADFCAELTTLTAELVQEHQRQKARLMQAKGQNSA